MASLFKDKPPFKTDDEGVDNLVRNMRLACASVENRFAFFFFLNKINFDDKSNSFETIYQCRDLSLSQFQCKSKSVEYIYNLLT